MGKHVFPVVVAVVVVIWGFSSLWGAEETLSIHEAVQMALQHNPMVKKAETELKIALSALKVAEQNTISPDVGVSQRIGLAGEFPSGFSLSVKDSYSWGDSAEEQKARVAVAMKKRALEDTREAVKQQVIAAYLAVLKVEGSIRLAEKNHELLLWRYERVKREYEKGNAAQFAVREAEKNLQGSEASLKNLQESLSVGKKRLNALLGRPLETDFALEALPEVTLPELELEALKRVAFSNRREIQDLDGQKELVEAELETIREARRPSVTLLGEYKTGDWNLSLAVEPFRKTLDWEISRSLARSGTSFGQSGGEESWGVGLVVSWTLASEASREAEKQNKLKLRGLDEDTRFLLDSVETELEEKYYQFEKLRSDLAIRQTTIAVEKEKFALRQRQYEMGAIDAETVLAGEVALLQAENDYRNNQYDLLLSWVEVNRATGGPLILEILFPEKIGEVGK